MLRGDALWLAVRLGDSFESCTGKGNEIGSASRLHLKIHLFIYTKLPGEDMPIKSPHSSMALPPLGFLLIRLHVSGGTRVHPKH